MSLALTPYPSSSWTLPSSPSTYSMPSQFNIVAFIAFTLFIQFIFYSHDAHSFASSLHILFTKIVMKKEGHREWCMNKKATPLEGVALRVYMEINGRVASPSFSPNFSIEPNGEVEWQIILAIFLDYLPPIVFVLAPTHILKECVPIQVLTKTLAIN